MHETTVKRHISLEIRQLLPTNKFADLYGVKPDTVRRNLCVKGHFLGIRPIKLPNGRLMWPAVTPDQLA